jgi:hypothetical protein
MKITKPTITGLHVHVRHDLPLLIFSPLPPIPRKAPNLYDQKARVKEFLYQGPTDVHLYLQIQWQEESL